jgi:hypothetical protein
VAKTKITAPFGRLAMPSLREFGVTSSFHYNPGSE